jgi:hypothetical protein
MKMEMYIYTLKPLWRAAEEKSSSSHVVMECK